MGQISESAPQESTVPLEGQVAAATEQAKAEDEVSQEQTPTALVSSFEELLNFVRDNPAFYPASQRAYAEKCLAGLKELA